MGSEENGDMYVSVGSPSINEGTRFQVVKGITHECYTPSTTNYDIALLYVEDSMTDAGAEPIGWALQDSPLIPGSTVTVSGWGEMRNDGSSEFPTILQTTTYTSISNEACQSQYSAIGADSITPVMVCAEGDNNDGVKTDSCQGDSGGPLVTRDEGTPTLVGVVSFGIGCATTHAGVYADVGMLSDWIAGNTGLGSTETAAWDPTTNECKHSNVLPPCDEADDACRITDCTGACFTECDCRELTNGGLTCDQLLNSWPTDSFCDDGAYGIDFVCEAHGYDGGACEEGYDPCPGEPIIFTDCSGKEFSECSCSQFSMTCSQLVSGWIDDGVCDDGAYGVDFDCDLHGNDGGDCADAVLPVCAYSCDMSGLFGDNDYEVMDLECSQTEALISCIKQECSEEDQVYLDSNFLWNDDLAELLMSCACSGSYCAFFSDEYGAHTQVPYLGSVGLAGHEVVDCTSNDDCLQDAALMALLNIVELPTSSLMCYSMGYLNDAFEGYFGGSSMRRKLFGTMGSDMSDYIAFDPDRKICSFSSMLF
jgi:hypothetical protein